MRIKLEEQLAPRLLIDSDGSVARTLERFGPSLKGRSISVTSYSDDAEGIVFSIEITNILYNAHFTVDPVIGRVVQVGLVDSGVKITGPVADKDFIQELGKAIGKGAKTRVRIEWNDEYSSITVNVGVKPIAGLPEIITAPQ